MRPPDLLDVLVFVLLLVIMLVVLGALRTYDAADDPTAGPSMFVYPPHWHHLRKVVA